MSRLIDDASKVIRKCVSGVLAAALFALFINTIIVYLLINMITLSHSPVSDNSGSFSVMRLECDASEPRPMPEEPILLPSDNIVTVNLDAPQEPQLSSIKLDVDFVLPEFTNAILVKITPNSSKGNANSDEVSSDAIRTKKIGDSEETTKGGEVTESSEITPSADSVDEQPREKFNPQPKYPEAARMRGREGYVVARILINEDGTVGEVEIVEATGDKSFRVAVLDALQKWSFEPARDKGRAVRVWALKTIRFVLED